MNIKLYKYHGAGNDFLIGDNRAGDLRLDEAHIRRICDRHLGIGSDGLMLLCGSDTCDFRMEFYNPDGTSGMMCGNGGRCIAAFAARLGIPARDGRFDFEAPDGLHTAVLTDGTADSPVRTVRLKMRDVAGITQVLDENACFLDTGTRHLVKFVTGLADYPVESEGKRLRNDPRFAPVGTNVDFVEPLDNGLQVRTFEKGVEAETLACGTGIVAAALAAYARKIPASTVGGGSVSYSVRAAIADLRVDFVPEGSGAHFTAREVWLTGPAEFVGIVEILS